MSDQDKYISKEYRYNVRNYRKNEAIFLEGAPVAHFYKILGGRIKLVKYFYERKAYIHYFVFKKYFFGFIDIIQGNENRRYSAIALDDRVRLERIPKSELSNLLKYSSSFRTEIRWSYLKCIKSNELKWTIAITGMNEDRVIKMLLWIVKELGKQTKRGIEMKMFRHSDLAEFIGISRQNLTEVLNKLKVLGLIDYDRQQLIIRDLGLLQSYKSVNHQI